MQSVLPKSAWTCVGLFKIKNSLPLTHHINNVIDKILPGEDRFSRNSENRSWREKALYKIILPSFSESIFVMSSAAIEASYLEPDANWYQNPLYASSFFLMMNAALRLAPLVVSVTFLQPPAEFPKSWFPKNRIRGEFSLDELPVSNRLIRACRSLFFASASYGTFTLIHEGGHALTAFSLFNDSYPQIVSKGFFSGGYTTYNASSLTHVGEMFGRENSGLITQGMGTGSEILASMLGLVAAQIASRNHPEIRSFLRTLILVVILCDVNYALSAYYSKCDKAGHDFCAFKEKGFSPLLIISMMVGLTGLLQLGASFIAKSLNNSKTSPQPAEIEEMEEMEEMERTFNV